MVRVYVDMVGDIFHYGHADLCRRARELGDVLVVGLMSDEDAEEYKRRPIFSLEERAKTASTCRYVDEVVAPCPPAITEAFILEKKLDIVVHAHTLEEHEFYSKYYVDAIALGVFRRLERTPGVSTTDIINRCKKAGL